MNGGSPGRCFPGSLGPGLPSHVCLVNTPASAQTWPHPSSIAGYPRQPSGRAGRCAPCPATGKDTPHRTHAVGTAEGKSVTLESGDSSPLARPSMHALPQGRQEPISSKTDMSVAGALAGRQRRRHMEDRMETFPSWGQRAGVHLAWRVLLSRL